MPFLWLAVLGALVADAGFAQTLAPKPRAFQQVTLATSASSGSASPGSVVSLWVDVTPKPTMRVYAPGAKNVKPIALVLEAPAGSRAGRPTYPQAELLDTPGTVERVPVYRGPFRITQPVTIGKTTKPGASVTFNGVVSYEACDDRLCYPAASIPVSWQIRIK